MAEWKYDGHSWKCLLDACISLNLDYDDVLSWIDLNRHNVEPDQLLTAYIRTHRYVSDGLIFRSLRGVALHHGISVTKLMQYVKAGFGIELAVHMIQNNLPLDYFELKRSKNGK